jgi:hypothetical protein
MKKIIMFLVLALMTIVAINSVSAATVSWKKAGTYKVGKDIKAGEYFLQCADKNFGCYFQVSKDSTGKVTSIITNDNFIGNRYITVAAGQYLKLDRGKFALATTVPKVVAVKGKYLPGMYKVGKDIPAGEYKVVPTGEMGGYVEVAKNSTGGLTSIVSNDNLTAPSYITVQNGQYLKLNDCYAKK